MRRLPLALVLCAHAALAQPAAPKPDAALGIARAWVTAMHDRDFTAAAATAAPPLAHNLGCGKQFDVRSEADSKAIATVFDCHSSAWESVFRKPRWTLKDVRLVPLTAKQVARVGDDHDAAAKIAKRSDHRFVAVVIEIGHPIPGKRVSRQSHYYALATAVDAAGNTRIDAILQGATTVYD